MDWENNLENPIQKTEKTAKYLSEFAASEQKTPFSHSILKLEWKNFTPQNHSHFRSISCFGVTKITTPIWLENQENVWTDLKKKHSRKNSGNDSKWNPN